MVTWLGSGRSTPAFMCFRTKPLLEHLNQLTANNNAGEFYLTDMAVLLRPAGERVVAIEATDAAEILGANTIAELVALDQTLRAATAKRMMAEGSDDLSSGHVRD